VHIGLPVCLLVIMALLTGCGGGDIRVKQGSTAQETSVTILAVNEHVGRAVFRLSCQPAGGDVPSPARACAALEEAPELLTSPKPFTCLGGTFSWWDITIAGRLHGLPIQSHTASCWAPQMDLLRRLDIVDSLEDHLLPRARQELGGGEQRTYPPGVLEPGDLVACEANGRRLGQGVPNQRSVSRPTTTVSASLASH